MLVTSKKKVHVHISGPICFGKYMGPKHTTTLPDSIEHWDTSRFLCLRAKIMCEPGYNDTYCSVRPAGYTKRRKIAYMFIVRDSEEQNVADAAHHTGHGHVQASALQSV